MGVLAAGFLPWIKHEGWLLLGALCVMTLVVARGQPANPSAGRGRLAAGAAAGAALLLAGPWLLFAWYHAVASRTFLPPTPAIFFEHLERLPVIAAYQVRNLASAGWNFVWPFALVLTLMLWFRPASPGATANGQRSISCQ